jgi:hypothetical protein
MQALGFVKELYLTAVPPAAVICFADYILADFWQATHTLYAVYTA